MISRWFAFVYIMRYCDGSRLQIRRSFDVARFIHAFIENPRCGEVYNIGGGKGNSCSILEAFDIVEAITSKKMISEYFSFDHPRVELPLSNRTLFCLVREPGLAVSLLNSECGSES